jgi:glycerophosphoryl diester phosphodiesterase
LRLVQLIDARGAPFDLSSGGDQRTSVDLVTPEGLAEIATYAQGIGVHKDLIIPRDAAAFLQAPTTLIDDAHAAGLVVHAWTFRAENSFLPADFRAGDTAEPAYLQTHGDIGGELATFFALGLDGVFTDFSDAGRAARTKLGR